MRIELRGLTHIPMGVHVSLKPEEWMFGLGSIIASSVTIITIAGGLENGFQMASVLGMTGSLSILGVLTGIRMVRRWHRKPPEPIAGTCWWVHGWGSVEIEKVSATHVHLRIEGSNETMLIDLATFGRRATCSRTIEGLQEREVRELEQRPVGLLTDELGH